MPAAPLVLGSAVFFNGYLLHRSLPNVTKGYRRAFANHYMSAESKLPWTNDGRFDVTDDMRGRPVARDPLEWMHGDAVPDACPTLTRFFSNLPVHLADFVLVSGTDPYESFAPMQSLTKPFLRAEVASSSAKFNEVT